MVDVRVVRGGKIVGEACVCNEKGCTCGGGEVLDQWGEKFSSKDVEEGTVAPDGVIEIERPSLDIAELV